MQIERKMKEAVIREVQVYRKKADFSTITQIIMLGTLEEKGAILWPNLSLWKITVPQEAKGWNDYCNARRGWYDGVTVPDLNNVTRGGDLCRCIFINFVLLAGWSALWLVCWTQEHTKMGSENLVSSYTLRSWKVKVRFSVANNTTVLKPECFWSTQINLYTHHSDPKTLNSKAL